MKKVTAVLIALLLCAASLGASAERVMFEAAGFSADIPSGWLSQDIADAVKNAGQTITLGETELTMLGMVMLGDQQGLLLMNCTVLQRPEGYDIAGELAFYEETFADSGESLVIDDHSFFCFTEGNVRYAYGYTDDRIFIVYAEMPNEGYVEQFDGVLSSIQFE